VCEPAVNGLGQALASAGPGAVGQCVGDYALKIRPADVDELGEILTGGGAKLVNPFKATTSTASWRARGLRRTRS